MSSGTAFNGYRPRVTQPDFSPQFNPHSFEYIPAFDVIRPVVMDADEAMRVDDEINEALHDALQKKDLPKRFSKNCKVIHPSKWEVTVVDESKFVEELSYLDDIETPSQSDMYKLVKGVKSILLESLFDQPSFLVMPFEEPEPISTNSSAKNTYIGMTAMGWKGSRAHYDEYDESENLTPLGTIISENALCISAIAKKFGLDEDVTAASLISVPQIKVIRNTSGFLPHEFNAIRPILKDVFPESLILGDPVIRLRKTAGGNSHQKIPVRSTYLRPQELELAMASFAVAA